MTVKQLINKLKKFPEDYKVVIPNDEMYFDGFYHATSIDEYIDGTVIIETDYKKRIESEVR